MKKLYVSVIILFAHAVGCAQEIKFPKIDMHHSPADFSSFQRRVTTDSFKFDENIPNTFQMDFRSCDLTAFDLSKSESMLYASFNTKTKFPAKLPKGYDAVKVMELGKNPGLGIRELHSRGITGKNVGVGIIDQALLTDHVEYADRLRLYEEIHCLGDNSASVHGPAVASIAVGKTVGVAPGAELYFIGQTNFNRLPKGGIEKDLGYIAQSIDRLVEVNRQLPKEHKIRVISISLGMVKESKGYDLATEAIKKANQDGIFVVTVDDKKFINDGMERVPLADPDKKESYSGGMMFCLNKEGSGDAELQIPMDSRTVADPTGKEEYYFSRIGGQSWIVPWTAGLYALACQAYADITPEVFWAAALETADSVSFQRNGKTHTLKKVVNPIRLMEKIQDLAKKTGAVKTKS